MKKNFSFFNKKVHFIGVAGSGMIALAQYLRSFGRCKISGSDLVITKALYNLKDLGVQIYEGHDENQVKDADIVVYSSAIPKQNCELKLARKKNKLCLSRGEFLSLIMKDYNRKIVVAGSHGKTTCSGILVHIFDFAGVTPSFMVGGELPPYFTNGRYRESSTFITESDESDGSFLFLEPQFSILTNIDQEHLNYYKTTEKLHGAFEQFVKNTIKSNGYLVANADDENIKNICKDIDSEHVSFFSLTNPDTEFYAQNIEYEPDCLSLDVYHNQKKCGRVSVKLMGSHNAYNILSCVALAIKAGVSFDKIVEGLKNFKGVKRRMQLVSDKKDILVFDDYGHHPTEVKVTINGLKMAKPGKLTCVFQPHRYSRIKDQLTGFYEAFNEVDQLVLTPIYSANEEHEEPELLEQMIGGIKKTMKGDILIFNDYSKIVNYLASSLRGGDVLLTMGAGDIFKVSHELAELYHTEK